MNHAELEAELIELARKICQERTGGVAHRSLVEHAVRAGATAGIRWAREVIAHERNELSAQRIKANMPQ